MKHSTLHISSGDMHYVDRRWQATGVLYGRSACHCVRRGCWLDWRVTPDRYWMFVRWWKWQKWRLRRSILGPLDASPFVAFVCGLHEMGEGGRECHCTNPDFNNNNNNNNNNNTYLLQLGCYPVAVVILHVYKTWNWLLLNLSREGYMRSM